MPIKTLLSLLFILSTHLLSAQNRKEVIVFTPLFLDSAFTNGEWKYGKDFPKQSLSGLEFYHGIKLAVDSLAKTGAPVKVTVYDTRNQEQSVGAVIRKGGIQKAALIIGYTNGPETKALADEAAKLKIPFVSINFPNDAGVTNNPYFVILNSTLRTHCEGLYEYLQQQKITKPILFLSKTGTQEDRLKSYIQTAGKQTTGVPLKIKNILLNNEISASYLEQQLDSTIINHVFVGSLDLNFATQLLSSFGTLSSTYSIVIYGMPTWSGLTQWNRKEWKGLTIVYSEPFYFNPNHALHKQIAAQFKSNLYARPSEMVYRGFDQGFLFIQRLITANGALADNLTLPNKTSLSPLRIQPVFDEQGTMQLQYFENKQLYFYRYFNGELKVF